MIRFINCLRKRSDVSHQKFREYWTSEQFNQRMDKMAELLEPRGYARNLTLQTEANKKVKEMQGASDEAYDAIIEYWWDSAADFYGRLESPEVQAVMAQVAIEDEPYFDKVKSNGFFTEGNRTS